MDHQLLQTALAELRPEDKLIATIAHWHETATKKAPGPIPLAACSYATAILVNGRVRWIMWGAGYAPEAIPPVVYGIETLLKAVPTGRWLEVYALAQLWDYTKFGGIGRYAMENGGRTKSGKELGCYPAIGTIIEASNERRWSLCQKKNMAEAPGHGTAKAIAIGRAKTAALQHKADHAPTSETHPKPMILQEFVDAFPE